MAETRGQKSDKKTKLKTNIIQRVEDIGTDMTNWAKCFT